MKFIKKNSFVLIIVFAIMLMLSSCKSATAKLESEYENYLFTYFIGNGPGEESIRYALSNNGFNFYALNDNKPIIDSKTISSSGGVRDPHILRSFDGKTFYMVVTDLYVPEMGWNNYAMILMKSTDLVNWTHSIINIPETYPKEFGDVKRVWAPQTIYDKDAKKYLVYWSMLGDKGPDIIYYAYANEDFTALENAPKQLYFSPTNSACIDGDIIYKDGKYHFFFKNEDESKKGIMQAMSDKLTEGYEELPGYMDQTEHAVEGSSVFKLIGSNEYILMYDVYMMGQYQFTKSRDLMNFEVVDDEISMNFHPRHGTVIPITKKETKRLIDKWGNLDDLKTNGFAFENLKD